MVPAFFISWIAWMVQMPLISLLAIGLPRPKGEARKSAMALTHLLYGALIPTLAMINFPQALLLGAITVLYLMPPRYIRWGILALHPYFVTLPQLGLNLRWEWETIGNLAWPGVFAVWLPLWILSSTA
jgi:glycosylphosphatidylinositol transamidase